MTKLNNFFRTFS